MIDQIHSSDRHIVCFCSPFTTDVSSDDISTWDYVPGDPNVDVVIVPERYYYAFADNLCEKTREINLFWNTYEEEWIEGTQNLNVFLNALSATFTVEGLWPTKAHRELAMAVSALTKRAIARSAPIVIMT